MIDFKWKSYSKLEIAKDIALKVGPAVIGSYLLSLIMGAAYAAGLVVDQVGVMLTTYFSFSKTKIFLSNIPKIAQEVSQKFNEALSNSIKSG